MALQLFSRVFTFILNQALFRMASPRAFGTAAIQFEFMLSTILFLSREGVRNALLRATRNSTPTTNLSFLPILIGFPLALVTSYLFGRFAASETRTQPHFELAIWLYALAALTELLSEPMHNMAMAELRTKTRVRAEGLGIMSKTVVTFLVLLYDSKKKTGQGELALLAFAGGQLAYGILVFVTYLAYYGRLYLWPKAPSQVRGSSSSAAYVDPDILRLSLTMTSQSVLKHFLTEGDKMILSWFSPLQDQGGYAIAVNYGSLVARIVFQPVEETSRVFFSQLLAGTISSFDKDRRALEQAARALLSLLSIQVSLSVILLVFGTAYMPIVLHLLLPRKYLSTSAPQVLAAWVWYIPVLAVNGTLEAFLSSVATSQDLNKQSRWMAAFSAIYTCVAIALYGLKLGDASLVYANIINLSIRIGYSFHFISAFFASRYAGDILRWKDIVPSGKVWMASAVSMALIWHSEKRFGIIEIAKEGKQADLVSAPVAIHVTLGGVLAMSCLGAWWMSSGRFLTIPHRAKSE